MLPEIEDNPLEECDDSHLRYHLDEAHEYLCDGEPIKAAFELGQYGGLILHALERRGDGLPPEDEEVEAEIEGEFLEMYRQGYSKADCNDSFQGAYRAGWTLAHARQSMPGGAAFMVERWAKAERATLVGETDAHRRAYRAEDRPSVPLGFGHDAERMDQGERVEMEAFLANMKTTKAANPNRD